MRKYLLAAVAVAAMASPAVARDGQPYIGVEGGILFPKDQDGDVTVNYTTTQTPATPVAPAGPSDTVFDEAVGLEYKKGSDIDLVAGYDFGAFRLEGEIGRKRAKLDEFGIDDDFVASLNTALNRPSAAPDPGAPGLPGLVGTDFDLDGKVKVASLMVNALADFGDEDGLSFYAGLGAGRARVKLLGDSDKAWAFQLIAGARYALSRNVDLGLKYRYFRTGKVQIADDIFDARRQSGPPEPRHGHGTGIRRPDDQRGPVHRLRAEVPLTQPVGEPDLQLRRTVGTAAAPPPPPPPAPPRRRRARTAR